jgi:hypothetical protein
MHQGLWFSTPPQRHRQGICDELRRHVLAHGPANSSPRVQVQHHRDKQPALGRPEVGKVRDPFLIRTRCLKLPIQDVPRDLLRIALAAIRWQSASPGSRPESLISHQALDSVKAAPMTCLQHIEPYTTCAIAAVAFQEAAAHDSADPLIILRTPARRPCQPSIEAAS